MNTKLHIFHPDYYKVFSKLVMLVNPKYSLEIGLGWGQSAHALLSKSLSKLISLTKSVQSYNGVKSYDSEVVDVLRNEFGERINIKFVDTTKITFSEFEDILYSNEISLLDFIYIDGSHDYRSVKNDINLVINYLGDSGVIAFDDYGVEGKTEEEGVFGVKKAVDELISNNFIKIFHERNIIAFRRDKI